MNLETVNAFPFDPCEFPFNLEVCGTTQCTDFYITTRTNCYCYIFEYILNGKGTLIYNGKIYHPQKGDIYILHKGSNHSYFPDKEDPWKKIWFNADGILVPNMIASYGLYNTVLVKDFNDEALFRDMFKLSSTDESKKDIYYKASLKFHEILYSIFEKRTHTYTHSNMSAIKELIDASLYKKSFSLQNIADTLCISKAQIIKIFKQNFDQTPYQYFITQRIHMSATMLLYSQMSINEISETLNFADQHYYSNVFRHIMGITPSQYRRKNQDINAALANLNLKKDYAVDLKKH